MKGSTKRKEKIEKQEIKVQYLLQELKQKVKKES